MEQIIHQIKDDAGLGVSLNYLTKYLPLLAALTNKMYFCAHNYIYYLKSRFTYYVGHGDAIPPLLLSFNKAFLEMILLSHIFLQICSTGTLHG
ncbi:hypothetical protein SAMN05421760_10566 [Neptunomonas antarctica]|uniref:Uncharacterized protein n=1 Tax=Neptunomonas antarctica TaxID=619304 RepID=A0A1N7M0Z8_9GAMM|nr:hypothetical protein SAMN05421760_10566 [Neptunomonas antarctica]